MPAVEIMVLEFPSDRVDPDVIVALSDAVDHEQVIVLDLLFLARGDDGSVRVVDADDELEEYGFGHLVLGRTALLSADDLTCLRDGLEPGSSAAVVVYELTWSRRLVDAVYATGGQVALHAQIPGPAIDAAMAMATG
jgi:hypothetical protein